MRSLSITSNPKHRFVNLYFQVHQPRRLRTFRFFDIGQGKPYFDDGLNSEIIRRVTHNCYLPAGAMLLDLIRRYPATRVTFSISGSALEQMALYAPEAIGMFRLLADTGSVEFLGETCYHSLSSVADEAEFRRQVLQHRDAMQNHLGVSARVFRNTELIFADAIAERVAGLGFQGMLLEGVSDLVDKPGQFVTHARSELRLIPRNFNLSDDVAFRFSSALKPNDFLSKVLDATPQGSLTSLGMDFETFGEHYSSSTGILEFLEQLIISTVRSKELKLINPSEAIDELRPSGIWSSSQTTSWADSSKDLSAWLGNSMQREAFQFLNDLLPLARRCGDKKILSDHRWLQTSDHYYYMSTKTNADGDVHKYFSPYDSPYEAFMNYMNVLSDLEWRIGQIKEAKALMVASGQPAFMEVVEHG
jgi:alpha-amylase